MAPDFWNNPKEAEAYVKVLRSKKKWIEDYNKAVEMSDELQLAYEFYKEGEVSVEELKSNTTLPKIILKVSNSKICCPMKTTV